MKSILGSFVVVTLALMGCGPASRNNGDDDGDGGPNGPDGASTRQCAKMDIVFVVDDSGSMQEEQQNLAANFPMFATLLQNYVNADGDHIDFRVALTTTGKNVTYTVQLPPFPDIMMTEMGPDGAFQNNCGPTKRWLDTTDADLGTKLACRADVGTMGSGLEMPLLMVKHALTDRVTDGTNAGFLRDDALLAVMMVTDEDDGSSTHGASAADPIVMSGSVGSYDKDFNPADEVAYLDTLKGHRSRWAAGVIAGDGACSSAFGEAANGARLKEFVQMANGSGTTQAVFSSICDGDLTIGLKKALDAFQAACGGIIF